jgi:dynein heavy chain
LTTTIKNFQKLPNIFIGNTKGKTLSASVLQIHEEFDVAVNEFMQVKYDIMDIEKRMFDDDFYKFRQSIKGLERRLASILSQSFDDSDTIIGKFKLLDSFEGLLTRPIIQDELEKKHITLLELYKQDLKTVGAIFMEGKALVDKVDERAPIFNNLPPITGALNWTTGLLERISEPMDKLTILSQSIKDREEYKDVCKLYHSLCKNLREYNEQKIKSWEQGVEEDTEGKLNKFLLVREETPVCEEGFVRVNFDPVLVRLLREVKYLLILNIEVPERAQLLFKKVDTYRS